MKKEDALKMDRIDALSWCKEEFLYGNNSDKDKVYFCGNSLGLQHKSVKKKIDSHLDQWKNLGVESHFSGKYPWIEIQNKIKNILKDLLGCSVSEIAIMNALTVNLHLLMVSFYRPSKKKNKILIEDNAFSSDRYMINSQLKFHGYDSSAVVPIELSENYLISEELILKKIDKHKDSLSLVLLPGIQYYNGQLIKLEKISNKCKKNNIILGIDLAHAIGNISINLNKLDVDFASWCSYKYLNSGAGGISGIYINSKHFKKKSLRFEGWWGNKLSTRFDMQKEYDSENSAEGWVISNPPVILLDMHLASLEIFEKVGIYKIFKKSKALTKFLYQGLTSIENYEKYFKIITPIEEERRGAQLSLYFIKDAKNIFEELNKKFVIDFRKPNVIRIAPVPLYNSFFEVYSFVNELKNIINDSK